MMRLLTAIFLFPVLAYPCGDKEEFPHYFEGSEGVFGDTAQCYPVKVIIPTIHKSGQIQYAVLAVRSAKERATTLEVAVSIREAQDKENKSEIDICANYETAPLMELQLFYQSIPQDDGSVSLCTPMYRIDDFMEHLRDS